MVREFSKSGDILDQYPELQRARNLFINLFYDRTPLVNLGYSPRQIEWALPVFKLIEGEGEVDTHIEPPSLQFANPKDPDVEFAGIYQLTDRNGYYIHAVRDETFRRSDGETKEIRLLKWIMSVNPVRFFDIDEGEVANIILFKDDVDTGNLDYLVKTVIRLEHFETMVGKENLATRIGKRLGKMGTFQAAWLNDAKTEFVVKAEVPHELSEPAYYYWKRLKPVTDFSGSVTPFGQKPNISHSKIDKVLARDKAEVLVGQLARQNIRI